MSSASSLIDRIRYWRTAIEFGLKPSDTVLEVGPGHAPHNHADVLLDRYIEHDKERGGAIVRDYRPLLQADATSLPFSDDTFDFAIASHVIEHVEKPQAALSELSRVAERYYIECPTLFWELFRPTREYHKWVILPIDDALVFYHKDDVSFPPFGTLFERGELTDSSKFLSLFFDQYQDLFLIRNIWEGDIDVVVQPTDSNLQQFFEGPYNEEMLHRVSTSPPQSHFQTILKTLFKNAIKKY